MTHPNDPPNGYHRNSISGSERTKRNAIRLRDASTTPELILWKRIRNRRLGGLKFRRQHPIGEYVADFFCAEVGLVIELDSSYHNERRLSDAARDVWMSERRLKILRFTVSELMTNEHGVLDRILSVARERRGDEGPENNDKNGEPSPQPSPVGDGRGGKTGDRS